jgi:hypothetical protein
MTTLFRLTGGKDAKGAKIATVPAWRTRRKSLDRAKGAKGAKSATQPA